MTPPLETALSDLELQLQGWRMTTAEIIYRLPDTPSLLQSFVWQTLDHAPELPRLKKFLSFWEREIEGPIHSVRVACCEPLGPGEWRNSDAVYRLH